MVWYTLSERGCIALYFAKYDCFVFTAVLPSTINGFITENADGQSIIIINCLLSKSEQIKAFRHELRHLKRCDLHRTEPARVIERG